MIGTAVLKSSILEFKKEKRKPTFSLVLTVILVNLCYLFVGMKKNNIKALPQAWESVLFSLPILNTLFLSVFMAVLASRSMDLEHKGSTWNLLHSLQKKYTLYLGKVVYGVFWLTAFSVLQMITTISFAKIMGFSGLPSMKETLLTLAGMFIGGLIIYQLQLVLSLMFSNQFAALSVNMCGTLAGLFMMYVSERIILPWSVIGALRAYNMDYDPVSRISTYTSFVAPLPCWGISIVYLFLTLASGLIMSLYLEVDSLTFIHRHRVKSGKLHTHLPAELIKLKRSPVWISFIIMPIISALIGIFNFVNNQDVLSNTWEDLWTQQSLFLGLFFLSPLIGIFCSLLWRMEHTGTNWNIVRFLESPAKLVKDKLLVASSIAALCILWIGVLFLISGKIIGITDRVPVEFYECMLCGILASIAITSLQLYLSLIIKSFPLPVGLAFLGNIAGLVLLSKGLGFILPYSVLQMGLKSTNLTNTLNLPAFVIYCTVYLLLFFVLSVIHINRNNVKTAE